MLARLIAPLGEAIQHQALQVLSINQPTQRREFSRRPDLPDVLYLDTGEVPALAIELI